MADSHSAIEPFDPELMPFQRRRDDAVARNTALGLTTPPESTVRWASDMRVQLAAQKAALLDSKKSSGKQLADAIAEASKSNRSLGDVPTPAAPISAADFDFGGGDLMRPAASPEVQAVQESAHAALDDMFADFVPAAKATAPASAKSVPAQPVSQLADPFKDDFLGLDLIPPQTVPPVPPKPSNPVPQKSAGQALAQIASFRESRKKQTTDTNEGRKS